MYVAVLFSFREGAELAAKSWSTQSLEKLQIHESLQYEFFCSNTMPIQFERPVGPHLAIKELEYISALHQSAPQLRSDGSVTAEDVVVYLRSRHGIRADIDYIRKTFMPGLAGALGALSNPKKEDSEDGNGSVQADADASSHKQDDEAEAVFDIVELVCILLIPHMIRAAAVEKLTVNREEDFFERVLDIILRDVTGSTERPLLTRELLKSIMECYGETTSPEDLDEMMRAASPNNDAPLFTAEVLANATTRDVRRHYKLAWEDSATTHYDDVFAGTHLDVQAGASLKRESGNNNNIPDEMPEKEVQRITTFGPIDYVAENFSSPTFTMILWLALIVVYFSYVAEINRFVGELNCEDFKNEFACRVAGSIVGWLALFAQLSVLGTSFVVLSSLGNSVYNQKNFLSFFNVFIGIATLVVACILPYFFEVSIYVADSTREEHDAIDEFPPILALVLAFVLIMLQLKVLFQILVPKNWYAGKRFFEGLLISGTAVKERRTKKASRFKIATMVEDALQMHSKSAAESSENIRSYGSALLAFESTVYDRETVGGILWAFKKIRDRSLFEEEGVWLHARLIASNLSQVFVAFFFIILIPVLSSYFLKKYPEETYPPTVSPAPTYDPVSAAVEALLPLVEYIFGEIGKESDEVVELVWSSANSTATADFTSSIIDALSNSTLENILSSLDRSTLFAVVTLGTGLLAERNGETVMPSSTLGARHLEEEDDDDFVEWLTPERWQFIFAMVMASLATLPVYTSLAAIWIPSSVSTILQFRSGEIGSLRDSQFAQYRVAPDLTTLLYGSTFWGCLLATLYVFLIVFGVAFLAVWEPTQGIFKVLAAQIVAICVTLGLKQVILMFLRKTMYHGLFRARPASTNFMLVILEVWSLGLTVGTVLARLVKMIAVSALYVGRIDTFFFARGVGMIGPIAIDSYPISFRKDLLLHEAHRHPYMERLGQIYMLKLRHSDDFGLPSGSAWRLVVVQALMPWLRRFRIDEIEYDSDGNVDGGDVDEHTDDDGEISGGAAAWLKLKTELSLAKQKLKALKQENEQLVETKERYMQIEL